MKNYFWRCFFILITAIFSTCVESRPISQKRVEHLVSELTVDPVRQQMALDELVLSGDEIVGYLPRYFGDRRRVASKNIFFLNTYPSAFEKYFSTEACTVDEVVIQFFCFRTKQCEPTLDPRKLALIREKFSNKKNMKN
jgi:hypothetical protein